jgi:pilus assembly protein CpaE
VTSPRGILAINPDPTLKEALAAVVAAAPGWVFEVCDENALAAKSAAETRIVQVDASREGAIQDFRRLTTSAPKARIIAAVAQPTTELVRQLFRAGAADVIAAPFTPEALRTALGDLRQSASGGAGKVISIIKGCGGAGATTLALNLAALSAGGDGRLARLPCTTAVVDLDLQFGDTDIGLDLQPRTGILDLLRAGARVDQQFFESVLTEHGSGFKLLAPPASVVPLNALDARSACGMLDHAAAAFSRTFVDHPAGWSDWTFPVLARSDAIVIVTLGTVGGALGARRVLNALQDADVQRPVLLVLNRIAGLLETFERPADIAGALKLPIDASLPADVAVGRAADRGQLLVSAFPKSPTARGLRGLAERLNAKLAPIDRQPQRAEMAR